MTIFCTLTMVLVASVLFVLLEGARIQEMKKISQLQTELALETVFANYNTLLWKEYGLLAADSMDMEEDLIIYGENRLSEEKNGLNLLQTGVEEVSITQMTLLTDGSGTVYINAVSDMMKETIGYGVAKELFNQYEVIKDVLITSNWDPGWIETGVSQELEIEGKNPIAEVYTLQGLGILELVLADSAVVSQNVVQADTLLSNRTLSKGISPSVEVVDWMDQILLQQYMLRYMSNYLNPKDERGFDYEMEYLIGGKGSDLENLKMVVEQILLVREVANFLYLTMDQTKYSEATILAGVLAGVSANPLIIETVKLALLTAWAFGESVLDVRALLQGKKIPLLKSAETWSLSLSDIGSIANKSYCTRESEWGLSYQDYLGVLLLLQQDQKIAMCAMDAQEATIRKKIQDASFCLDRCLVQSQVEVTYTYNFVFYKGKVPWKQLVKTKASYSYH